MVAEEGAVAVNGVRRQDWAQVEEEQSETREKCPSALKKEFRCSKCAQPLRLRLQRGRGDPVEA